MPTPKQGYYNAKGERVPGVTTVIGRFKDSGALIHWANQLAYEPYRKLRAWVELVAKSGVVTSGQWSDARVLLSKPADFCDYRKVRDAAAGVGTIVHARIDCSIRGKPFQEAEYVSSEVPDPLAASQAGYQAFLEWESSTSFKLVRGEVQLVSNEFNYGGTPDVCFVNQETTLADWKSGDLYAEQVVPQLAAYRHLLVENGQAVGEGAHAISVNKKTGGFTHRYFTPPEIALGWNIFLHMRQLYELLKQVT